MPRTLRRVLLLLLVCAAAASVAVPTFALAGAAGYYRSQAGLAFGAGYTTQSGQMRFNAAITVSPTLNNPEVGAVAGASWSLN